MKILYLDCFSGISGDMTLGALVDAGADRAYIEEELAKLSIEPFTLEWKRVNKRGISALKLDVVTDPDTPPQYHRHYSEIVERICKAGFNDRVVQLSLAIFAKIGAAEAKIHGIPVEQVHFHEVGAIDSIADVVGVALAIDSLEIEKVVVSPVPLGSGTVRCDHGIYPVPAPATLEMMRGLPIAQTSYAMEMTTPTGAGIVSALADEFAKGLPPMIVETIGYGAGTRDLPNQPNVLRAVVGQADPYLNKYYVHHAELPHSHEHEHEDHHHHHADHAHPHEHGAHTHGKPESGAPQKRTPSEARGHEHAHEHLHVNAERGRSSISSDGPDCGELHTHEAHSHSYGLDHDHTHYGHEHTHRHDNDHTHHDHGHDGHEHTNHHHAHDHTHHAHDHAHDDHGHAHHHDDHHGHGHRHGLIQISRAPRRGEAPELATETDCEPGQGHHSGPNH